MLQQLPRSVQLLAARRQLPLADGQLAYDLYLSHSSAAFRGRLRRVTSALIGVHRSSSTRRVSFSRGLLLFLRALLSVLARHRGAHWYVFARCSRHRGERSVGARAARPYASSRLFLQIRSRASLFI